MLIFNLTRSVPEGKPFLLSSHPINTSLMIVFSTLFQGHTNNTKQFNFLLGRNVTSRRGKLKCLSFNLLSQSLEADLQRMYGFMVLSSAPAAAAAGCLEIPRER